MRLFLTAFLVALSAGYAAGLFFVNHETSGTPDGIARQFRGSPEANPDGELRYEKSVREMFVFIHNHLLALSLVFLVLGGIFWLTSIVPPVWKGLLMIEPMFALLTTFGGIALMRFVSPDFVWLVVLSGAGVHLGFAAMTTLILVELWRPGR
jgi:hypothetical protein